MLIHNKRRPITEGIGEALNYYSWVIKLQLWGVLKVAHVILKKTEVFSPESSVRHGSHLTQIECRKSYSGTFPAKAVTGRIKKKKNLNWITIPAHWWMLLMDAVDGLTTGQHSPQGHSSSCSWDLSMLGALSSPQEQRPYLSGQFHTSGPERVHFPLYIELKL